MKYRRVYVNGGTYFFTVVTYNRQPILNSQSSFNLLNDAIKYTANQMPFEVIAYVVMPDHMHFIWTLPEDSSDFSTRWRLIKSYFTRNWCKKQIVSSSASRKMKGEKDIWQRRFWEHLISDEADLTRHVEYIHYNPIKHGFVDCAINWKYSSFTDYVRKGLYPKNWGEGIKLRSGDGFMK